MKTDNYILATGAIFGGLSVAIGAFAAHGLKAVLDPAALSWVQTGAQYQMYHGLVILIIGFALKQWPEMKGMKAAAYCFSAGIILFSGSLYALAATQVHALGIITPLGGLALLAGWSIMIYAALRQPEPSD